MIRRGDDAGAGVVWVLLVATALWSITTWGLALSAVAAARAKASSAADLAALAGAEHAALGATVACDRARAVVVANDAAMRSCEVDTVARTVELLVEVRCRGLLADAPPALARARAGPDPP